MNKQMEEKIKSQLSILKPKLHCQHNAETPCDGCRKKITGNISSGLTSDISGIKGDAEEIIKLLEKAEIPTTPSKGWL